MQVGAGLGKGICGLLAAFVRSGWVVGGRTGELIEDSKGFIGILGIFGLGVGRCVFEEDFAEFRVELLL